MRTAVWIVLAHWVSRGRAARKKRENVGCWANRDLHVETSGDVGTGEGLGHTVLQTRQRVARKTRTRSDLVARRPSARAPTPE